MSEKLRTWLEEEIKTTPEQRNWNRIEPKLDSAMMHVDAVSKLLTKGSKQEKGLVKILNSLKAIKADVRGMSKR